MNRKVFTACAIPGLAILGYGIYGLVHSSGQTRPTQWVRWFLGGLLIHDFVIAPAVFLVAVFLIARVPQPWRAPLQGGLIASGMLILAAWPYVAGYGRRPDNLTLLPNNYGHSLLVVLTFVWVVAVAIALWRRRYGDG